MAMYVYETGGAPVGFVFETSIYSLDGQPVGRIVGSRVHRFDGSYVGEWFQQMVVARPEGRPRFLPPRAAPPKRAPIGTTSSRRPVAEYALHLDVFDQLLAETSGQPLHVAAE